MFSDTVYLVFHLKLCLVPAMRLYLLLILLLHKSTVPPPNFITTGTYKYCTSSKFYYYIKVPWKIKFWYGTGKPFLCWSTAAHTCLAVPCTYFAVPYISCCTYFAVPYISCCTYFAVPYISCLTIVILLYRSDFCCCAVYILQYR